MDIETELSDAEKLLSQALLGAAVQRTEIKTAPRQRAASLAYKAPYGAIPAISPGGRPANAGPIGKPGNRENWVDRAGGLPRYIRMVAHALIREHGFTPSHAIATAVNKMKKWSVTSKDPKVKTAAAKAVAEWEAKKGTARARSRAEKRAEWVLATKAQGEIETKRERGRVRTPAGVARFGKPIGSPIGGWLFRTEDQLDREFGRPVRRLTWAPSEHATLHEGGNIILSAKEKDSYDHDVYAILNESEAEDLIRALSEAINGAHTNPWNPDNPAEERLPDEETGWIDEFETASGHRVGYDSAGDIGIIFANHEGGGRGEDEHEFRNAEARYLANALYTLVGDSRQEYARDRGVPDEDPGQGYDMELDPASGGAYFVITTPEQAARFGSPVGTSVWAPVLNDAKSLDDVDEKGFFRRGHWRVRVDPRSGKRIREWVDSNPRNNQQPDRSPGSLAAQARARADAGDPRYQTRHPSRRAGDAERDADTHRAQEAIARQRMREEEEDRLRRRDRRMAGVGTKQEPDPDARRVMKYARGQQDRDDEETEHRRRIPETKRYFSRAERQSLARSGAALPDGSFPIVTEEDLHNAQKLVRFAKDPAKAQAHIAARAAALGIKLKMEDVTQTKGLTFPKGGAADPQRLTTKAWDAALHPRVGKHPTLNDGWFASVRGMVADLAEAQDRSRPLGDQIDSWRKIRDRFETAATGRAAEEAVPLNEETLDEFVDNAADESQDAFVHAMELTDSVKEYGFYGYQIGNGLLRLGQGDISQARDEDLVDELQQLLKQHDRADVQRMIDDLHELMEQSHTTEDIVVYRAVGDTRGMFGSDVGWEHSDYSDDWRPTAMQGMRWKDHGFTSTATDWRTASEFLEEGALPIIEAHKGEPRPIMLKILVPKGTPALSRGERDGTEVLLTDGLEYEVVTTYMENGHWMAEVVVVGGGHASS